MDKTSFMYVGRLVPEKGIHYLLELIHRISADEHLAGSITIHIFGDGVLRNEVEIAADTYSFVHYHGHHPKEVVMETRKNCQYTLMLSLLLETFGLVALDSLSVGVPVIGFKKGGVQPFIDDDLDVLQAAGDTVSEKIRNTVLYALTQIDITQRGKKSEKGILVYQHYTIEKWIARFNSLVPVGTKKILLCSDYAVDVGGIENFLLSVVPVLQQAGYEVRFLGLPKKLGYRQKYLHLLVTLCNWKFAWRVKRVVDEFHPDVIRRHSVHRRIGWYPVRKMRKSTAQQWIMYHDFGMFHPFPSLVETTSQVEKAVTFGGYVAEAGKNRIRLFPILVAKRCSIALIKYVLRQVVDLHIVPSAYMESLVKKHYHPHTISVTTFSHFIRAGRSQQ